jgi:hypothetical protein
MKQLLRDLKIRFTEANITSMFAVLDPFNKGQISLIQMEAALANFGVDSFLFERILGEVNGPFRNRRIYKNDLRRPQTNPIPSMNSIALTADR